MKFAGWALLVGAWLVYGLEVGDALAALLLLFGFGVIARAYAAEVDEGSGSVTGRQCLRR